jgi:hypothetical protein
LGLPGGSLVAAFTALYIVLLGGNFYLARMIAVVVGALVALAVNLFESGLFYRSLFQNRIHICRNYLAWALEQAGNGSPPEILDRAFTLLNEVKGDLAHAGQEIPFGRKRLNVLLASFKQEVEVLGRFQTLTAAALVSDKLLTTDLIAAAAILRGGNATFCNTSTWGDEMRHLQSITAARAQAIDPQRSYL